MKTKGIRPRGPKPKPVEEHRRNRVMLNLTDAERSELEKAADGRSVSDFARDVLLRYLARRR